MYNSLQNLDLTDQQKEMLNHLLKQAERYEKLRKVNAMQFSIMFNKNITTNTPFDDLVDKLNYK